MNRAQRRAHRERKIAAMKRWIKAREWWSLMLGHVLLTHEGAAIRARTPKRRAHPWERVSNEDYNLWVDAQMNRILREQLTEVVHSPCGHFRFEGGRILHNGAIYK